jgi:hypothetical protein
MHEFQVDELVYYDSSTGLIKCKIQSINKDIKMRYIPDKPVKYTLIVTTLNHRIYKKGDIIESSYNWVIPRRAVYISFGQYRIRAY